jgi:release factor glutamine methyltransferase
MLIHSKAFFNNWWPKLTSLYPESEAKSLVGWLLEDYFGINRTDLLLDKTVDIQELNRMEWAIARLLDHEPVQHLLGYAWFMDRKFNVSPEVLIPRQETEELVRLIIDENPGFTGNILDIGTGSGIIPISLKLALPQAQVSGLDVSASALNIAQQNAAQHAALINWIQLDIMKDVLTHRYEIIVSNPPYIMDSEKIQMSPNVVGKDPDLALFVPDDDPLRFYRQIVSISQDLLHSGGQLYFEINERFGSDVSQLLTNAGFAEVKVQQDLNGKDRMVYGSKKNL